jgi:dTDP-4-dehydrorhamnose reductase
MEGPRGRKAKRMKILITGANGMVAKAAIRHCRSIGDEVIALTRAEMDITNPDSVRAAFSGHRPEAVLNCAAYTNVDGAQSDEAACRLANAEGVENLAVASRAYDARFLTISTDYVFGGDKTGYYTQRDTPDPQGVYALTKYEGETLARSAYSRSIIVRSGWIYGREGTNFLSLMPQLLAAGKRIKAISDSYGNPTFADDMAVRLRRLIELDMPCIFHVSDRGPGTSYLGFAEEVCRIGGFDPGLIDPVSRNDLSRPAPRPVNSKIECLFSRLLGLPEMPDWRETLRDFIDSGRKPKPA